MIFEALTVITDHHIISNVQHRVEETY